MLSYNHSLEDSFEAVGLKNKNMNDIVSNISDILISVKPNEIEEAEKGKDIIDKIKQTCQLSEEEALRILFLLIVGSIVQISVKLDGADEKKMACIAMIVSNFERTDVCCSYFYDFLKEFAQKVRISEKKISEAVEIAEDMFRRNDKYNHTDIIKIVLGGLKLTDAIELCNRTL